MFLCHIKLCQIPFLRKFVNEILGGNGRDSMVSYYVKLTDI